MSSLQTTQVNLPPGMIDLGLGQPAPTLLPLTALREAAENRLSQADPALLAYGAEQGDGYFRLALAQFLSQASGLPVEAEHLFVTNGASQGLDLICALFTRPGDTVLVEEPSYFLALRILADHHLNVVGVPLDEKGLIIDALEEKLDHHKPVFLYTIPVFHNPAGVTLAADRRKRLVELSAQRNFLIVADEVYHLLAYRSAPPPPLAGYDAAGTVLSLGSFSKILGPGLRLGWIQARPALLERFVQSGLLDSGGGLSPFVSGLVREVIESGRQQRQLSLLQTVYRENSAVLSQALQAKVPALQFVEPEGGFFIWAWLPPAVDTAALLPSARRRQVGFLPGGRFSSQAGLQNYMRLCFAYYDKERLTAGVDRLAQVVADRLS